MAEQASALQSERSALVDGQIDGLAEIKGGARTGRDELESYGRRALRTGAAQRQPHQKDATEAGDEARSGTLTYDHENPPPTKEIK
jgi:hypothetical protein